MKTTFFRSTMASGLLATTLSLCSVSAVAQTLTIGSATTPSLDPHFQYLTSNVAFNRHVFSALTQYNRGSLESDLALTWKALSPTQWEFKLRPNVKFHDGGEFSAEDVVFSINRLSTLPNNPIPYTGLIGAIKSVKAVDALTVHVETAAPEPLLPINLSTVSIVSKKAVEGASAASFNSGKAMIGSGPYKFQEFVPGARYEIVRNDAYFGPKPVWQKVVFRLITQDASRIAALLAGEVDLIDQVPPADAAKLRTNAGFSVYQTPSYRVFFVYGNQSPASSQYVTDKQGKPLPKNPMRDARVREALSLALDRKAIISRVMDGAAGPISQFAAQSMSTYNKDLPELVFDPVRAKKLLADAGYPDGFGLTIHCSNDRYPNDGRICQTVGQMLSRIGLEMKVEAQPKTVYFPKIFPPKGEYMFGLLAWGALDGTNATGLTSMIHSYDSARKFGTYNAMGYSNSAIDARIEALSAEFDMTKRIALERALQTDVAKEWPLIPLFSGSVVAASKKGISFSPRPDEMTLASEARPSN